MLHHFNRNLLLASSSFIFTSNSRLLCIESKTKRGAHKIRDHFEKSGQITNLDLFAADFQRATSKKPPQIYVANEQASQQIVQLIGQFYEKTVPFVELSPGPCILSKALLNQLDMQTLLLIENDKQFADIQQKLQQAHHSNVHLDSFKKRWNTSLSHSIVKYCERREWSEDVAFQLFLCSQLKDIHYMSIDAILQSGIFTYGRAEIFTVMTPLDFMKLTAGSSSPYWMYTHASCLFQIIFEYEKLAELPNDNFLPWYLAKPRRDSKEEYDRHSFYLVRITPKRNLFSLCNRDDLPRLRFFIYQCMFKRKGYIIPKLEKWIPGIGIDLITRNFKHTTASQIYTSNKQDDYLLENLTNVFHVFTECGSLSPMQMCALFQFFCQTPQYKMSCFHQQFHQFFATKSNKALVTTDHDGDIDKFE